MAESGDLLAAGFDIPVIRAELELAHGDAAKAIELLRVTTPYELGGPGIMAPAYCEGWHTCAEERCRSCRGVSKMLDHRGLLGNSPTAALAHLGLARARARAGDAAGSRAAYQDFFALWKDADPDIPILQQAKAEYAKLK